MPVVVMVVVVVVVVGGGGDDGGGGGDAGGGSKVYGMLGLFLWSNFSPEVQVNQLPQVCLSCPTV